MRGMATDRDAAKPAAPGVALPEPLARCVLGALWHMARADGVVNPHEIDALHGIAARLGLLLDAEEMFFSDVDVPVLVATLETARSGGSVEAAGLGSKVIEWAREVALADGRLGEEEAHLLDELIKALAPATA